MAFVDNLRGAGEQISDAQLADVLEAVLWERAKNIANGRPWKTVAEDIVASIETSWPSKLCSLEKAAEIGVTLEVAVLRDRFTKLGKTHAKPSDGRKRALKIISQSGQIALPPDGMTLWQFFKPEENELINKGALAAKERALAVNRNANRKAQRKRARQAKPTDDDESAATAAPRRGRPSRKQAPGTDAASMEWTATPPSSLEKLMASAAGSTLPGLLRGQAAGITKGQGRDGAIQRALKVAVRDLVVEDRVSVRDVPKVLVDVFVALTQKVPKAEQLITHSHIRDWICALAAEDMLADRAEFWSVRREFGPMVVLLAGHDGTRRAGRKLGRHGELMQFLGSYFNPRPAVNRAVEFMISIRFTVGGSAANTACALAVNLADGGLYKLAPSPDSTTPFKVKHVLQKGVLFDLGTDNTGSALNVSPELEMLTGEPCGTWHCPTHINAMDGKTPMLKLAGEPKADSNAPNRGFNAPSALNIGNKWWYICDKHGEIVNHWWVKLKCDGSAKGAIVKARPLMGKWESMGAAHSIIYSNSSGIRKFAVSMEYHATGMPGVGSLKEDCKLLAEWMHGVSNRSFTSGLSIFSYAS